MDAFLDYFIKQGSEGKNLFVSNPPGPALLIWSDFSEIQKISGITLVRSKEVVTTQGIEYQIILRLLREKLSNLVPILEVIYANNLDNFQIGELLLSNVEAASYLSKTLGIKLGKNPAKKPNKPDQINDPFHIWSREVFDGVTVRKVDVDAIQLDEKKSFFRNIIEVKRSNKIKIGTWTPFINPGATNSDYWNYIMALNLCKLLTCKFITVHHEIVEGDFSDDTEFETFEFDAETLISNETISAFGLSTNRKIFKAHRLK
jgi:hypothetical protein